MGETCDDCEAVELVEPVGETCDEELGENDDTLDDVVETDGLFETEMEPDDECVFEVKAELVAC